MSSGIKVFLGVLGGALLVLVLFGVFGGGFFGTGTMMGPGGMMGQGGMMDGGWGAWNILWMLVPLLFWGGLLVVIVWAVIRLTYDRYGNGDPGAREEAAEEILRQRFAHGEIDAEEYESRRRVLSGGERS